MALKVLIVEDEPMAQANLSRTLQKYYPDLEIIGTTSSVSGTVEWLKGHSADVIFMDVELSDGDCFSIFRQINVDAKIVMTTAYDSYAVKAFEVNSVDYLLKPIEKEDLDRAVQRCRNSSGVTDMSALLSTLAGNQPQAEYRQKIMVRLNDKILPVSVNDIAYFLPNRGNTSVTQRTRSSGCSRPTGRNMCWTSHSTYCPHSWTLPAFSGFHGAA